MKYTKKTLKLMGVKESTPDLDHVISPVEDASQAVLEQIADNWPYDIAKKLDSELDTLKQLQTKLSAAVYDAYRKAELSSEELDALLEKRSKSKIADVVERAKTRMQAIENIRELVMKDLGY
jgi:hypothetical protein